MRLLNTATLELEEFIDDRVPTYAILSHRWQDDEVTFQDMQRGGVMDKLGYSKIKKLCDLAKQDYLKYAWVDTCCIDKSSSAELSEAINSMYRWYQRASVCYVYLSDVKELKESSAGKFDASEAQLSFLDSKWWTRGWTLQELIAPSSVEFYNTAWQNIGNKLSLESEIVLVTGIDATMLEGSPPERFSIAKRMSWAANRTTTRVEDIAYSLLGIFNVNMPMLYGEGDKAFIRLQEEIMKQSDDHSIFAWSSGGEPSRGILAKSPLDFQTCSEITVSPSKLNRSPYSVTNLGLSIELLMVAWAMETYIAALDCQIGNLPNSRRGIFLQLLPESNEQCIRVRVDGRDSKTFDQSLIPQSQYRRVYVRQKPLVSSHPLDRMYGFWLRKLPLNITTTPGQGDEYNLSVVHSRNTWDWDVKVLEMPTGARGTAGVLWYKAKNSSYSYLKLGFDAIFNPVCEFGGPFWGPTSKLHHPERYGTELTTKLDNGWISRPANSSFWFYKGDRFTGLSMAEEMLRITITRDDIDGRKIWVVDVERSEQRFLGRDIHNKSTYNAVCDGCGKPIYVLDRRFKCQTCPDFDYCSGCQVESGETHPGHEFALVKVQDDEVVVEESSP